MSGEPQQQQQQQQLSIAELRDIAARQQAHIDEQLRTLRQREAQMTELAGWAAAAAAAAVGNSGDPRQRRRHLQQLAASVDAQAERLRRQRSVRQQLAHYRHANGQLGRELASARAECQARQEEMVALAAKLDAMHRQAAAIAASASQPPPQQQQQHHQQQQQQHQRQNSRPLPPLPPLPPPSQRKQQPHKATQQPEASQQPPPAPLQRRRLPPQAPPSPPPSHRRHAPPAPAAASAAATATATASSATPTELLLSRDRLDDLIRREATAAPNQRDSLVVQDPADQAEAAEAKADAAAAAAAADAEKEEEAAECEESEKPSEMTATPGSETDSSGEEDPACLTEEPPSLPSSGNRCRDDPPGAPTGWLAPIAKLDDEDDLSLSDYDEASGKPGAVAPAAPVPGGILSNGSKRNHKAKNSGKLAASDGKPGSAEDQPGGGGQQRSVTFDPLTLLLDAAIEGDLQQVQRYTSQLGDPSAASAEGITALHNAVCAGHSRIVQYLIDSGADVNSADQDGWTPLHCAVSCDSLPLTKLLVGSGAVLHCTTHSESETPLDLCHNDGPVEAWLRAEENRLGVDNSGRVFAAFDYTPEQTDELSLARGDQLTVLRKGDGAETAWWWCRRDSDAVEAGSGEDLKEGYVARNFVSLYKSHG